MVATADTEDGWRQEYFYEIRYFRQAGCERSSLSRGESTVI